MSYERGGCLLCPGDDGAHPARADFPDGACHFAAASPCAPLQQPIGEADRNETSVGGSGSSPVRSASRLWPPDGTGALGLLPDASNPARNAGDARQAEAGPRARARNYAIDLMSDPPINAFTQYVRPRVANPSDLPRLWPPGWNGPPLDLLPRGFAPRRPRADDARRGGDRPPSTAPGTTAQLTFPSISSPVVHSIRATSRRTSPLQSWKAGRPKLESSRERRKGVVQVRARPPSWLMGVRGVPRFP